MKINFLDFNLWKYFQINLTIAIGFILFKLLFSKLSIQKKQLAQTGKILFIFTLFVSSIVDTIYPSNPIPILKHSWVESGINQTEEIFQTPLLSGESLSQPLQKSFSYNDLFKLMLLGWISFSLVSLFWSYI